MRGDSYPYIQWDKIGLLRSKLEHWHCAKSEVVETLHHRRYSRTKGKYPEVQQMHSRISSSSNMKKQKHNTTLKTNQTVALSSMPLYLTKLANVTAKHRPSTRRDQFLI